MPVTASHHSPARTPGVCSRNWTFIGSNLADATSNKWISCRHLSSATQFASPNTSLTIFAVSATQTIEEYLFFTGTIHRLEAKPHELLRTSTNFSFGTMFISVGTMRGADHSQRFITIVSFLGNCPGERGRGQMLLARSHIYVLSPINYDVQKPSSGSRFLNKPLTPIKIHENP